MMDEIVVAVVAALILWMLTPVRKWIEDKCKSVRDKYQSWRDSRKPAPVLQFILKDGEKLPTRAELKEKADRLEEIRRYYF